MTDSTHSCGYHCDIPACIKQQRDKLAERKPLTDEQILDLLNAIDPLFWDVQSGATERFARAIERAHGITEKEASNAG